MQSVYSVSQINTYIKNMFTQDFMLSRISVSGEISNCKYHTSGHIYFSLKDETGAIACVMFAGQRKGLAFSMKDGHKVVVSGSVNVYERDGRYQVYAKEIKLEGTGLLYERFIKLKDELEEMGMFAGEYKKPIPKYIKRLGIVTAATGAAIRDIENISNRRNPFVQLVLYPAFVQGEYAAASIVKGIETLDRMDMDIIIVGRGGGSIEDLWAFNEEEVARAIFHAKTPVISAVGHETDTTIADYVADLRAPTPSAAAELAVYDISEFLKRLAYYRERMVSILEGKVSIYQYKLEQYRSKLNMLSPENQIREKRQQLLDMENKIEQLIQGIIRDRRHQLDKYIERLKGLSPLAKLNQGFSYVTNNAGQAVTSVEQIKRQDILQIQVRDGNITAEIADIKKVERGEEEA